MIHPDSYEAQIPTSQRWALLMDVVASTALRVVVIVASIAALGWLMGLA